MRPAQHRPKTLGSLLSLFLLLAMLQAVPAPADPADVVDPTPTAEALAQALVGDGVAVNNVTFKGDPLSRGSFAFTDPTVVGFSEGIVMSSGIATTVIGPNVSDSTGTDFSNQGDADLTALSLWPTYDAAVLEFDFVPVASQVTFSYAFASDEYPEWVNTPYNDVFAFFVNGVNAAEVRQVAGDSASPFVPVAVNNINDGTPVDPAFVPTRPDLFRANYYTDPGPSAIDLELDGITHVLTFQSPVIPDETNHMKLAIADASDGIYDSAVFIQAGSIVSNDSPVADLSVYPETGSAPLDVTAYVEAEDVNDLPLDYTINWGDGTVTDPKTLQPDTTDIATHTFATGGTFQVTLTVTNGTLSGTSTEDVEVFSVPAAPVVIQHPTDQTVTEGDLATFSSDATGDPAPTVQWQVSTDGTTWDDLAGETSTTLSFTSALSDDGKVYHAVFTNTEGSDISHPATLTVVPAPVSPSVTTDPIDLMRVVGTQATFEAAASGYPTPDVQWQVLATDAGAVWTNLTGETFTQLTFTTVAGDNGNLYRAVFTNSAGSDTSAAATLTTTYKSSLLAPATNSRLMRGHAVKIRFAMLDHNNALLADSDASGLPLHVQLWSTDSGGVLATTVVTYNNRKSVFTGTLTLPSTLTRGATYWIAVQDQLGSGPWVTAPTVPSSPGANPLPIRIR